MATIDQLHHLSQLLRSGSKSYIKVSTRQLIADVLDDVKGVLLVNNQLAQLTSVQLKREVRNMVDEIKDLSDENKRKMQEHMNTFFDLHQVQAEKKEVEEQITELLELLEISEDEANDFAKVQAKRETLNEKLALKIALLKVEAGLDVPPTPKKEAVDVAQI